MRSIANAIDCLSAESASGSTAAEDYATKMRALREMHDAVMGRVSPGSGEDKP
jgi:hypothetical protein